MTLNDNGSGFHSPSSKLQDSHGHAALLLVESLIHGLCERSILNVTQSVAIVERALEVQEEIAANADGAAAPMWRSHALLSSIAASLRSDDGFVPAPQ